MKFFIIKFYDHHRSNQRLLYHYMIFAFYFVLLSHTSFTNISSSNAFIISSQTSSKSTIVRRNIPVDTKTMTAEKCYFHANGKTDGKSFFYGQCMSMNGPDGCCLEGHYKPGICSNLGHICCINPDPECNAMFTNKGNLF